MTLHAAVLAGGSGTRLWPAGTRALPKQFLPLLGDAPLLVQAVRRLDGLVPPERTLVITAAQHVDVVRELLPELPAANVFGEPSARNTAAACGLASHVVELRDPGATLAVLPADHVVEPAERLRDDLAAASERAAGAGSLLTLGLEPTRPATGYGWIRLGEVRAPAGKGRRVHAVERFLEKPDRATAQRLLEAGGHVWNLGMFVWRADRFLEELALHLPQVAAPLAREAHALDGGGRAAALECAYRDALSISVDYGVFERSAHVECVPCDFAWDDLGSFEAVARHLAPDALGNRGVGAHLTLDAEDNVTWSHEGGLTALLGVHDLVVVHTPSVTLVAPRARAEEVRRLVAELGRKGLEEFA